MQQQAAFIQNSGGMQSQGMGMPQQTQQMGMQQQGFIQNTAGMAQNGGNFMQGSGGMQQPQGAFIQQQGMGNQGGFIQQGMANQGMNQAFIQNGTGVAQSSGTMYFTTVSNNIWGGDQTGASSGLPLQNS